MRRAIMCGVLALAAAMFVPTAAAEKPIKEPLPAQDVSGQFCPEFEVSINFTDNKEVIHIFSSGVAMVTGVLKVEVTNLDTDTPKTIRLNISGPGKFSADGSTVTGSGRWLLFGEAGQLGPGAPPGMLLVAGHSTLQIGPSGILSMDLVGHVEDICAALAA